MTHRWPDDPLSGRTYLFASDPREVTMSDKPNVSTPEPVLKAGAIYGSISALVVTALGVLVAVGVLSSEEAAAINDLNSYVGANLVGVGTALVGVVGVVSGLVSHIVTAFAARTKVVPTNSDVYRIVPATEAATPVVEA